MNEHGPSQNYLEQVPRVKQALSFTEQLLAFPSIHSDIPYELRTNFSFLRQIESRKKLIEAYATYTANIENITDLHALYAKLSTIFTTDKSFARAALYIPFDILPDTQTDQSNEAKAFLSSYKSTFINLFDQSDFRADFMDGDVLEPSLRNGNSPELITKAPHLLPWLMRKGIFSQNEVISLIQTANTPPQIQALVDVLPILYRESLLDDQILDTLTTSPHTPFQNLLPRMIKGNTTETEEHNPEDTPKEILNSFILSYQAMEQRISLDSTSPERKHWQTDTQSERLQDDFAYKLAPHIDSNLDVSTLDALLAQNNTQITSLLATALRIKAGMEFEMDDKVHDHTEKLITHLLSKITRIQNQQLPHTYTKLAAYAHQYGANIDVSEVPQFIREEETSRIKNYNEILISSAEYIEKDPVLSAYLYPVTLSLGSHAKGYAKEGSDIDMGVFVREGTDENERTTMQERLVQMSLDLGIHGSCMEFWLEEKDDGVVIKNYENPDPHRGDNSLTHPFTGQWLGNLEETKQLREKLIRMYLESSNKTIDNHDARTLWLKDLEHNMLQYRLMHKGYASHMPPETVKRSTGNFSIDGDSMFYDEGYRRIAFDTYLKKVFLPVFTTEK